MTDGRVCRKFSNGEPQALRSRLLGERAVIARCSFRAALSIATGLSSVNRLGSVDRARKGMGTRGPSGAALNKLAKELKVLQKTPEEGIRIILNENDIADVQAEYEGPDGTPFAGGLFRMRLQLDGDYPSSPPKGYFLTKIFHPNVSKTGEICVNVLKKDWKPDLGIRHVLLVIRCLLIEPFPESALNEEAGKLLLDDYEDYAKHARLMTSIHAVPVKRQMPLSAEAGANQVNSQDPEIAQEHSLKKPKAVEKGKTGIAAKKRSLKRL